MKYVLTNSEERDSRHRRRLRKELEMRQVDVIATALIVVGAVNWGLVGFAGFDLVAAVFGMEFGQRSALTSVVYGLVGLAGVYRLVAWNGVHGRALPVAHR